MRRLVVAVVVFTVVLVIPGVAAGKPSSPITVDKTATGHVTRTSTWDISKTVSPEAHDLPFGGSGVSTFEVAVSETGYVDTSSVAGEVCVTNESSDPVAIVAIDDVVEYRPGKGKWRTLASAAVDLGGVSVIAPADTYCYPYEVSFVPVAGADYRNVATVSSQPAKGKKLGRVTAKTGFVLPTGPDVFVDESINVVDTNGMSWTFSDSGTETYDRTYATTGSFTNTVEITETGQVAAATVTVNVGEPCATTTDAVAYWCFDDLADPTLDGADGHDANLVGSVFETTNVAPAPGNLAALKLDGIDDYAWTPDPGGAGNLDGFSGLTIAGWINPDTLTMPDGSRVILSKYHSALPYSSISYWLTQRGDEIEVHVTTSHNTLTGDGLTSSGVDFVPGEWRHVAGTWDGAAFRLYADGVLVGSKSTSISVMDDSEVQVNIGSVEAIASGQRRATFFSGLLDEIYLFDRALSQGEIAELAGS